MEIVTKRIEVGTRKVNAVWTPMTFDLVATPGFYGTMMSVDPIENPIIARRNRIIKSLNNG